MAFRQELEAKPNQLAIGPTALLAVLLLLVFALFIQAQLGGLARPGTGPAYAFDIARLLTLPVLLIAVLAIGRTQSVSLLSGLARDDISTRIVLTGIVAGLLMRAAASAHLTALGSFGLIESATAAPALVFRVGVDCPGIPVLLVSLAARALLVPLAEEIIHRGIVQSYLYRFGAWPAIFGSTALFTLTHEPGAYGWIALMGFLFAMQYFQSGSLWLPLITHASYNSLNALDELCIRLAWNPPASDLPLIGVGSVAISMFITCLGLTALLTCRKWVGKPDARGPGTT